MELIQYLYTFIFKAWVWMSVLIVCSVLLEIIYNKLKKPVKIILSGIFISTVGIIIYLFFFGCNV